METRTPFFLTNLLRRSPKKSDVIQENGWGNTPQESSFNGWGSSPGSTSSGAITNGWANEPPENHYNGWGSDSLHRPQSVVTASNGWAYESSKDEYNGWGSGLGSGSNDKCTTSKEMSAGLMDEEPEPEPEPNGNGSRPVQIKSWAPVPSAPPLPEEGFSDTSMANGSDYSRFDFMEKDAVAGNQGKNRDPLCVVCWEAPVEGACIPCGHMASCMTCLHEIKSKQGTCPVCRAKIDNIMRIYAISTE